MSSRALSSLREDDDASRALSSLREDDKEATIPVLNTFLMKQIIEDGGKLTMIGTFVQNCYEDGPESEKLIGRTMGGGKHEIKFDYRFNDETADEASGFTRHRLTKIIKSMDMGTVYRHTFQVKAPLDVNVEFDFFPFRVVSAKLLVELSSTSTDNNVIKIKPDLLLHLQDKTNMFCIQKDPLRDPTKGLSVVDKVRGWLGNENAKKLKAFHLAQDRMDKCSSYDFISPFPKVSYLYDKKKKYCPKFLLKFMMVEDGMKKFVAIVAPMFLIAGMNTIHVLNTDKDVATADYLANSATFALSVMVFLPTMVGTSRVQYLFTVNNLYIVCIFVALTLSSIPDTFAGHKRYAKAGMYMNWASFIFPLGNSIRYWWFIRKAEKWANAGHFWSTGDKKPYDAEKQKQKITAHLFKSVGEVVYMQQDAQSQYEYKLRPFEDSQKMRVLEFASERAVIRKEINEFASQRSVSRQRKRRNTNGSEKSFGKTSRSDAPEKIEIPVTEDDPDLRPTSPEKTAAV